MGKKNLVFSNEFIEIAKTDNLGSDILKVIKSGYSPYKMIEDLFHDLQNSRKELIDFKLNNIQSSKIEVPFDSLPKELQDKIVLDRKRY